MRRTRRLSVEKFVPPDVFVRLKISLRDYATRSKIGDRGDRYEFLAPRNSSFRETSRDRDLGDRPQRRTRSRAYVRVRTGCVELAFAKRRGDSGRLNFALLGRRRTDRCPDYRN